MCLFLNRSAFLGTLIGLAVGWTWAASPTSVAAADDAKKVAEGKPAPDVDLPATRIGLVLPERKGAKDLRLSDLRGKKNVVLYFFPKALTKGWTIEACGFRDLIEQFAQYDTVVIGISTDTLEKQQEFTNKENLNFPLYADADKKVAKEFGVLMPQGYAQRATFVIDKQGIIRKIYPKADASKHPAEVLAYVREHFAEKR
jgi:peroxiredoxin Q/BCP